MSISQSSMLLVYENQSDNGKISSSTDFSKEKQQATDSINDEPSNVLKGSFTFTPRFLHSYSDNDSKKIYDQPKKTSSFRKWSQKRMVNGSSKTLKRKAVKRKISIRSRQHLIPLSEQLREERGEIVCGECSTSNPGSTLFEPIYNLSAANLTTDSIRTIVREEIRRYFSSLKSKDCPVERSITGVGSRPDYKMQTGTETEKEAPSENLDISSNLDFETTSDPATEEQEPYEKDLTETCDETRPDIEPSEIPSEVADSDVPEEAVGSTFLSHENRFVSSQKSFRTILQLQIEIWQKLLQLKESTEILEKIALRRQLKCRENHDPCLKNEMNSSVVTDHSLTNSILSSSLKAVFSQLDSDEGGESHTSNDFVDASFSCYSKMNEIEHRLSDVEIRMTSIHKVLQAIRQQQYLELKSHQSNVVKNQQRRKHPSAGKTSKAETVGDGCLVKDENELQSDPPNTVNSETTIPIRNLSHYDESYYEWRQYHMNLLHYKKSERTIALNKRPMVNIMKPSTFKYLQHNDKRYIRVKKPFFIVTPSRKNSFYK